MRAFSARSLWAAGLVASLALLLTSCYLFVGTPSSIVPQPGTVTVLEPPAIVSCSATPIRTSCQDIFERVCGWTYVDEPIVQTPDAGWIYTCWNAWRGTLCWFDISIQLVVEDPSNDLREAMSPRVRVFDAQAISPITAQHCLLDVSRTDIPIYATDVTGSGPIKTVTVRLRNIQARFVGACRIYAARLRFAIVLTADGRELTSTNTCTATVECRNTP